MADSQIDEMFRALREELRSWGVAIDIPAWSPPRWDEIAAILLRLYHDHESALAFTLLVRITEAHLARKVREIAPRGVSVDEIVADVYFIMFSRGYMFRGGRFESWMISIASNLARTELRRMDRQTRREKLCSRQEKDESSDPVVALIRQEERAELIRGHAALQSGVREFIENLGPVTRRCLDLAFRDEWTYSDIAREVGLSKTAVAMRVHRARKAILARLRGEAAITRLIQTRASSRQRRTPD